MTPELIGSMSIVVIVSVMSGLAIGRRYGERRERERQARNETLAEVQTARAEMARNADDIRERLQRVERRSDETLLEVRTLAGTAPPPPAVPAATDHPTA